MMKAELWNAKWIFYRSKAAGWAASTPLKALAAWLLRRSSADSPNRCFIIEKVLTAPHYY